MSDAPTDHNRLADTASPYLRQHADNPVNWQPWDDDALDAARERDVPIFLSVGYSACHWCHVMEEESFQDEGIAAVLNENYVPIKVDREERPDLDRVYQTICQLVTQGGGWPLSAWLTPEGRPFYVGTYFPPEESRGRPGFRELLTGLAETWENDRGEMESRAEEWMDAIEGNVGSVDAPEGSEPPGAGLLESVGTSALRAADREHGGFGTTGAKFPHPSRVDAMLRLHDRTGRETYREVAYETLNAMATRGMYDHVGGGFHRYATDRDWSVPHFEKMLYDNAELPRVYLAAYQATGIDTYAETVERTLSFVERELSHPDGGFYSTLDAQSENASGEREEGAFYTWTPGEVSDALDDAAAVDLFRDRFGVTERGDLEGSNVLAIRRGVESLGEEHDLTAEAAEAKLDAARETLFDAREERPRPARDEKVLAGWNGLAISAFAEAGIVLDSAYAERASEALAFVDEHLRDGTALERRYEDVSGRGSDAPDEQSESSGGAVGIDGYLEDYAFLARGALDCYQATGDVAALSIALDLARGIEAEFWDEGEEALYFTPASGEDLIARPQELTDQSTPSSAGVAIDVLLALDGFVLHDRFAEIAESALTTYRSRVESSPLQHTTLALAADRYATGSRELTVVAEDLPGAWRERIGEAYLPNRLLSVRPPDLEEWLDRLDLAEAPPIWADRDQRGGEPTVYACESFTCSPPTNDVGEALSWFEDDAAVREEPP
jgi:uncharacterized protein YyaL (SSP411 family)